MTESRTLPRRRTRSQLLPLLAVVLLAPDPVNAAEAMEAEVAASLWQAGTLAFEEERWDDAAAAWEACLLTGVESADLHYNLGNAHFQAGRLGYAILSYERALRLDPWHADARHNLSLSDRRVLAAAGEDPAGALGRGEASVTQRILRLFTADGWALGLGACWSLLFVALVARRYLRGTPRGAAFVVALLAALATPLLGLGLWGRAQFDAHDSRGVVVAEKATLRAGPSADNAVAFDVREGVRVAVTGNDAGWLRVRLPEGLEAWAAPGVVEPI